MPTMAYDPGSLGITGRSVVWEWSGAPAAAQEDWQWQTIPQGTAFDDRMLAELNRRMKKLEHRLHQ